MQDAISFTLKLSVANRPPNIISVCGKAYFVSGSEIETCCAGEEELLSERVTVTIECPSIHSIPLTGCH